MTESSPTLRHYLEFLRRQGWLILLIPAFAVASAAFVVSRQDPVYRASMGIIVAQGGGESRPEIGDRALTQTMTNILESDVVSQRVVNELNLGITSGKLRKKLKVSVRPDSSIMTVSYESTSKRQGLAILSSTGRQFLTVIRQTLGVSGRLNRPGPLLIIADIYDPPHIEPERVSPRPAKTIGFAGALGLALGLVFGFVSHSLDDRVRSRRDAEEWFGARVIGTLPPGLRRRPALPAQKGRRRKEADALDILRANLQFSASGPTGPSIVVTSALENEGKTAVVANLGMALASAGNDVIVVEADLRRSRLHRHLRAPEVEAGLVDVIEGRTQLAAALYDVELFRTSRNGASGDGAATEPPMSRADGGSQRGRLRLLPGGTPTPDPTTVLSPDRITRVVDELKWMADYVIFDCPPLLSAGEAVSLAVSVESVFIVARQGFTTRSRAQEVRAMLEGLGARRVSVVLVDARETLGAVS